MRIAVIQQQATPDTQNNVSRALSAMKSASNEGAQLAVFPELAFTRFYPQFHADDSVLTLAESIPGPTTELFMDKARETEMVTIINLFEEINFDPEVITEHARQFTSERFCKEIMSVF